MNRSDLRALRERLQARQAQAYPADHLALDILGGVALGLLFLFILFI